MEDGELNRQQLNCCNINKKGEKKQQRCSILITINNFTALNDTFFWFAGF